jgi:hypothetical protein
MKVYHTHRIRPTYLGHSYFHLQVGSLQIIDIEILEKFLNQFKDKKILHSKIETLHL